MRIEPPPSLPWASGTMPAATAAAAPPEEPPGVRSVSHGLRVGPEAARLGDRQDPELGQVGLADDHEAGLAQAPHHEGVVAGREVAEEVRADACSGMPATATRCP